MVIDLNVFCLESEEQIDAQEIGVGVDLNDCVLRKYTFVNIDFIAPTKDNPNTCIVSSGGSDFLVNHAMCDVKQMIRDSLVFKFN